MANIQQRIEAELPRLRRYARALVRDVVDADDLVQECLTRALAKLDLWREGAWKQRRPGERFQIASKRAS